MVSGCALPAPLSYFNYLRLAWDGSQALQDEPTSTERTLGLLSGKNCRMFNMIDDKDICIEKSATEKMREYVLTYNKELN